jgi:hypothetical protein
MTPTARTLRELRRRGLEADVVERWIGGRGFRIRKDLFGCWDVAAVGNGELVLVQTTSGSNVSSRIRKIADAPATPKLREANIRLLVHGWRKNAKGRWVLREEDVS